MVSTCFDGVEEVSALRGFFDVCINQERVSFGMDVFHHDLEAVETSGFRDLNFITEPFEEVFVDDAVGSGEKGKDMGNEESFIFI